MEDIVAPPLRLLQNVPSLSFLSLNSGLVLSRDRSAGTGAAMQALPRFCFFSDPGTLIVMAAGVHGAGGDAVDGERFTGNLAGGRATAAGAILGCNG
jgi:hypothetical protein